MLTVILRTIEKNVIVVLDSLEILIVVAERFRDPFVNQTLVALELSVSSVPMERVHVAVQKE